MAGDEAEEEAWWDNTEDTPTLWNDEEERGRIIEAASNKENEKEVRVGAILELRGKAMDSNNREMLWEDEEVRALIIECSRGPDPNAPKKSLYSEGPEVPDEALRMVALSTMCQLSQSSVCRRAIADDPKASEAIIMAVGKYAVEAEQSYELRQRGFIALTGVCLAGTCSRDAWKDPVTEGGGTDVFDAMLLGFKSDMPEIVRSGVVGTIWSLVCQNDTSPVAVWKYKPLREAVVACAMPGEPFEVRENALGLLWGLATCEDNREAMWTHEYCQAVLVQSVPPTFAPKAEEEEEVDEYTKMMAGLEVEEEEVDEEADDPVEGEEEGEQDEEKKLEDPQTAPVREKALCAITALAAEKSLREAIWSAKKLGPALLDCTKKTEPPPLRAAAIRCLLELGVCYENQLSMYGAGVPEILTEAAADKTLPLSSLERRSCKFSVERIDEGAEWAATIAAEEKAEKDARLQAAQLETEYIERERQEAEAEELRRSTEETRCKAEREEREREIEKELKKLAHECETIHNMFEAATEEMVAERRQQRNKELEAWWESVLPLFDLPTK